MGEKDATGIPTRATLVRTRSAAIHETWTVRCDYASEAGLGSATHCTEQAAHAPSRRR